MPQVYVPSQVPSNLSCTGTQGQRKNVRHKQERDLWDGSLGRGMKHEQETGASICITLDGAVYTRSHASVDHPAALRH